MYGHGGTYFPTFCENRVKFQVDSVGKKAADEWSWEHILSLSLR